MERKAIEEKSKEVAEAIVALRGLTTSRASRSTRYRLRRASEAAIRTGVVTRPGVVHDRRPHRERRFGAARDAEALTPCGMAPEELRAEPRLRGRRPTGGRMAPSVGHRAGLSVARW